LGVQCLRIETAILPLAADEHIGTKERVGDCDDSDVPQPNSFKLVRIWLVRGLGDRSKESCPSE